MFNFFKAAGCIIGKDYPKPIVDHDKIHKVNIGRMKAAYAANKTDASSEGSSSASKSKSPKKNSSPSKSPERKKQKKNDTITNYFKKK